MRARSTNSQKYDRNIVRRATEVDFPTLFGHFRLILYENPDINEDYQIVIIKGDTRKWKSPPVRIHSECFTGETLGSLRCDCREQLHAALEHIEREGHGVVIYLRQEGRGIGLKNKIIAYKLQDDGMDTVEANKALCFKADLREYRVAAKILKDLGVNRIRMMTNNHKKIEEIYAYGINVEERIPLVIKPNQFNKK